MTAEGFEPVLFFLNDVATEPDMFNELNVLMNT